MENLSKENRGALAIKRIEESEGIQELNLAQDKQYRQSVHCQTITSRTEYNRGHQQILRWIKDEVLDNETSFNSLNGIINPPFPTNELSESIYSDVGRLFGAQDFYQKFTWSSKKSKDQEAEAFFDKIKFDQFWEIQGVEIYKTEPDCYIVCDKPKKAGEDPYFYKLSVNKIRAISLSKDVSGIIKVDYIAFVVDDDTIAYFDNEVVILYDEKDKIIKELIYHKVGWTPVFPFWQSCLNPSTLIQKSNRTTKSLSEMDWLFFYEYAKKWQDLNNPFPIWAMYDYACSYTDESTGATCNKGYLNYEYEGKPQQKICPSCANKFKRGPDRIIRVPAPQNKEEPDLMSNSPIQAITAETANMQFVTDEVARLNAKIYKNCAGLDVEFMKNQAINKDQVASFFEARKSILKGEKRNFDIIRNSISFTLLRMKFGDAISGCETDHGECWYLESEQSQVEEYKTAKESSLPMYDLKTRREALIKGKFRNNPEMVDRAMIMAAIEPSPDMTINELVALKTTFPELVDDADLIVKKNFSNFIDRFEKENGSLSAFGQSLTTEKVTDDGESTDKIRLEKIKSIIYGYAKRSAKSKTTVGGDGDRGTEKEAKKG